MKGTSMIPTLPYGRTGHISTRLLFGAAAFINVTQKEADQTMELVMEAGINHIDTANIYGLSQERLGPWMKKYRDRFFLASKTIQRTYAQAKAEIQRSLDLMQTDHLDLMQLHMVIEEKDFQTALGPGGALEALMDARSEGLVHFIGVTSHDLPAPLMEHRALEIFDFDSVLLPWNYMFRQNPTYRAAYEALRTTCEKKNVAVQIIKTAQCRLWAEGEHRTNATWYRPFDTQPEIDLATHWAMAQPGVFINTISNIGILPMVIDAAKRFEEVPSDEQMDTLVKAHDAEAMWS
jgi:aryl-alcohol dehydrogenase-like predicted oxidoreductase